MAASGALFTPCPIGPVTVKNRFMRSATWDSFANADGTPQPRSLALVSKLAAGEVGLILPSNVLCDPKFAQAGTFGLFNASQAAAWRPTIDAVHARGSKLFFQIFRPGLRLGPGQAAVLPTARSGADHELTSGEIDGYIELFLRSAKIAASSGADGIQLHCCHGTFLSTFLSPAFNRRTDQWGGSYQNRARIVREILLSVQKSSPGLATSIKFNGDDFMEGGITPSVVTEVIRPLIDVVDLFEVSSGMEDWLIGVRSKFIPEALTRGVPPGKQASVLQSVKASMERFKFDEEFNRKAVDQIRKRFPEATLAIVGGNRQLIKMSAIVEGVADIVSLSRPLLKNPFLVRDFLQGKAAKSNCWNCGSCLVNFDQGVFCHTNTED